MPRLRPLMMVALLAALAACQAAPETVKRPSPRPNGGASGAPGSASSTPFPEASAASPGPGESLAPGQSPDPNFSPFPAVSASPSAAPQASADPTQALSAQSLAIAQQVLPYLGVVARQGFELSRASARGKAPVGSQGVGYLGNDAARKLTQAGDTLLGGDFLATSSDQLMAAGGYRLSQALLSPGPLQVETQVGEGLQGRRLWAQGGETRHLVGPTDHERQVRLDAQGKPIHELGTWILKKHPGGARQEVESDERGQDGGGAATFRSCYRSEYSTSGALTQVNHREGYSFYTEAAAQVQVRHEQLSVAFNTKTGLYRLRYPQAAWVESGDLKEVASLESGLLPFNAEDPLGAYAGEGSLKDAAGKTLFLRAQSGAQAGDRLYRFPEAGGAELKLRRVGVRRFSGELVASGAVVATAELNQGAGFSQQLSLRFTEAPSSPITLGYGWGQEPQAAAEAKPPTPSILTLAGGANAAHQDGAGLEARFRKPYQIARSVLDASLYYVVDGGGHRIRTLRFGAKRSVTVGSYAGTGASGSSNGAASISSFESPFGLAVGPGDDLYVAEGKRIRLVRKKTTGPEVSTFAGQGAEGQTAFALAAGLHLSTDGLLYVADADAHRVYAYGTKGGDAGKRLATYGAGTAGGSDGAASVAKFNKPIALALHGKFLYVAEQEGRRIRRIALDEPAHTVTTLAVGPADRKLDKTDGPLPAGPYGFSPPGALLAKADGSLLFGASDLRVILPEAVGLRSLAGGPSSEAFMDGPTESALFTYIFGLCEGPDGALLLSDGTRVRALVPAGWLGP